MRHAFEYSKKVTSFFIKKLDTFEKNFWKQKNIQDAVWLSLGLKSQERLFHRVWLQQMMRRRLQRFRQWRLHFFRRTLRPTAKPRYYQPVLAPLGPIAGLALALSTLLKGVRRFQNRLSSLMQQWSQELHKHLIGLQKAWMSLLNWPWRFWNNLASPLAVRAPVVEPRVVLSVDGVCITRPELKPLTANSLRNTAVESQQWAPAEGVHRDFTLPPQIDDRGSLGFFGSPSQLKPQPLAKPSKPDQVHPEPRAERKPVTPDLDGIKPIIKPVSSDTLKPVFPDARPTTQPVTSPSITAKPSAKELTWDTTENKGDQILQTRHTLRGG